MFMSEVTISQNLRDCFDVIEKYKWLLDAYVLDFYVDDHWLKLPACWRRDLEHLPLEAFSQQLLTERVKSDTKYRKAFPWPLELLALNKLLRMLCINRKQESVHNPPFPICSLLEHPKLKHLFRKCVKPKKHHEITHMAAFCARSCQESSVDFVVDFGAGLGHLARILGYGYGVKVCCIEMQRNLNEQAASIDKQLEVMATKHLRGSEISHFRRPTHLTEQLSHNTQVTDFIAKIKDVLHQVDDNFTFGIIGLHPCGDLGAILTRTFLNCKQAKFLNLVGCCYQKLSTPETKPELKMYGYPLSKFLNQQRYNKLSYQSREIACHAVEMYSDRLLASDYEYLKIHSFRAAAERIIVEQYPELKHSGLRSVKHMPEMTFESYCHKAMQGTPIAIDQSLLRSEITKTDLLHWRRIVIFYTLRLMLAPLVESTILYDRILFLLENDCLVEIHAIFDPHMSPRNHITSAVKGCQ